MILRASFKKVEEINDFEEFLTDAIQHITNLEQQDNQFSDQNTDRGRDRSGISDGIKTFKDSLNEAVSTSNNNANNKNKNNNKFRAVKVGTLENLREVQYAFIRCKESLVTGLTDDNLFSTTAEDYKQWSSVPDESLSGEGTRSSTSTNSNRGGSIPTFDNSDTESDTVEDLNNLLYGPKTV